MIDWFAQGISESDRDLVLSAAVIYDKINAFNAMASEIKWALESKEAKAVVVAHQAGIKAGAKQLGITKNTLRNYIRAFERSAYRKATWKPKRPAKTAYMHAKHAKQIKRGSRLNDVTISGLLVAHHLMTLGVNQNYALFSLEPGEMARREKLMMKWLRERQRGALRYRKKAARDLIKQLKQRNKNIRDQQRSVPDSASAR